MYETSRLPLTASLQVLSFLLVGLVLVVFVLSIVYFSLLTTTSSIVTSVYSPGCSGLSKATVVHNLSASTGGGSGGSLTGGGGCVWTYQAQAGPQCASLEEVNIPVTVPATVTNWKCQGGAQYLYFTLSGTLQRPYENSITCTGSFSIPGVCPPDGQPNSDTIIAGVIFNNNTVCYPTNPVSGPAFCFEGSYPSVLPHTVRCSDVIKNTPEFICTQTTHLAWFSVLSQSASAAALSMTILTPVFQFILRWIIGDSDASSAPPKASPPVASSAQPAASVQLTPIASTSAAATTTGSTDQQHGHEQAQQPV